MFAMFCIVPVQYSFIRQWSAVRVRAQSLRRTVRTSCGKLPMGDTRSRRMWGRSVSILRRSSDSGDAAAAAAFVDPCDGVRGVCCFFAFLLHAAVGHVRYFFSNGAIR